MKFTILGFSHPAAYDLGLDINDLAFLDGISILRNLDIWIKR